MIPGDKYDAGGGPDQDKDDPVHRFERGLVMIPHTDPQCCPRFLKYKEPLKIVYIYIYIEWSAIQSVLRYRWNSLSRGLFLCPSF